MKKFTIWLFAQALAFLPLAALAQSNPGLIYGQIPSAQAWNSYFASKLDYNVNGLPIAYGGTGAITGAGALNNLAGSVPAGQYLRGTGTGVAASPILAGDVPTLNQNTTGTAASLAGGAAGSIPYQSAANATAFLVGNSTTTPNFFTSTGTGTAANAPTLTSSTGSGSVVLATSPTLVTPNIGAATATTINGNAITTGTGTLTLGAGKTLAASNSLTLAGTDGTVMTFPSTSATIARTDAANTFSGVQTFSGTVAGTALSTYLASPPAIGGTVAAAGSFTTLSASSTVSGSGFSTYLASPPSIGSGTPGAGAFTTLSASSTVSGTGFSTYLASPPAIGGTAPASVMATTVTATTGYNLTNLMVTATAPTASCGSVVANGSAAFRVTLSSGTNTCTITLPAAVTGWNCFAQDITTVANAWQLRQTGSTTTSATLSNYSGGVLTAMNTSDVLAVSCFAY